MVKEKQDRTELEITVQNGRRETGQDRIRDDRIDWYKRNRTGQN